MSNLKSALETATNVALLIVCSLLVWLFVAHRELWLHGRQQPISGPDVLVGKTLAPLPEYDWKRHDRTLVLAIRQGCSFCEASMPFYKRLSELQKANQIRARLLAVMPDQAKTASVELQSGGVNIEGAFQQPLSAIYVSATPTLLMVNAQGKVERDWVGQLSSAQETEVITALQSTVSARN